MAVPAFIQCHFPDPQLGEFLGLMRRQVSRSFLGAVCTYRSFGSTRPTRPPIPPASSRGRAKAALHGGAPPLLDFLKLNLQFHLDSYVKC